MGDVGTMGQSAKWFPTNLVVGTQDLISLINRREKICIFDYPLIFDMLTAGLKGGMLLGQSVGV